MQTQSTSAPAAINSESKIPFYADPIGEGDVAIYVDVDTVGMDEIDQLHAAMARWTGAPRQVVVCGAITLPVVIKRLVQEQIQIASELNAMEPDAWLNARGRALANREQELQTTLTVLRGLSQQPVQIQEPAAAAVAA